MTRSIFLVRIGGWIDTLNGCCFFRVETNLKIEWLHYLSGSSRYFLKRRVVCLWSRWRLEELDLVQGWSGSGSL